MSYILILIGCVFVNNVVLSQFMGICPFLGVSKQMKSSVGMGAAVIRYDMRNSYHISCIQTA